MPRAERLANLGLLIAMIVAAIVLFVLSRDLTFWSDELDWLTFGDGYDPKTLLTPHNSHLIGTVRVIYEAFPSVFGADYLPFRILSIAAVLACAGLFFVLARRRIGGPIALLGALILLFFGSSSEVVLSPLGLPISLSVAFGLATFVALEQETRGWDAAALAFLVLSILSDTFGAIIGGGVLLYLVLDRDRRRRAWVAIVPLALYVIWWIWARQFDQSIADASNLGGVPAFVLESGAATVGAITGVGKSLGSDSDAVETAVKVVFGAVAIAAAAVVILRARRVGSTAALWAFGLTLLGFWVAIGLSESDTRTPSTPRYLLFAVIMAFLILAEAFRRERIGPRARTAIAVVLGLCLVGNVARLVYNADGLTGHADEVATQLAMIELAGDNANPEFSPSSVAPRGSREIVAGAGALNAFIDEYGSLGFTIDEVKQQQARERSDADAVLAAAYGLALAPVPDTTREGFTDCQRIDGRSKFELQPGISLVEVRADADAALTLRRFGDDPTLILGAVSPSGPSAVGLPADEQSGMTPWVASSTEPLKVCLPEGSVTVPEG